MKLNTKEQIEITIRAAQIIKSVSGLIGTSDTYVASLVASQAHEQLRELDSWIRKVSTDGALR